MSETELSKYFLTKKIPYVKPLYNINIKKESEVLDWFRETSYGLTEYFRPLFREQKANLAFTLSEGVNPSWASPYTQIYASTADVSQSQEQIFINDLYRLIMDQVTMIISHELIPDVLPNTEDYSDKVACNVVKDWLESMNYNLSTENWRFRWEFQKKVFGESFCIVMWNPNIGDIHPLAKEHKAEEMDMLDENGNPMSGENEAPIKLPKNMRVGDIQFINPLPWDVIMSKWIISRKNIQNIIGMTTTQKVPTRNMTSTQIRKKRTLINVSFSIFIIKAMNLCRKVVLSLLVAIMFSLMNLSQCLQLLTIRFYR
jgi:hypothetical protein